MAGTEIRSITARQVYTNRGNPGVEAVVTTENGATGRAMCTSGISIGTHEIHFDFDGGERFRGKGVLGAVRNVNEINRTNNTQYRPGREGKARRQRDGSRLRGCFKGRRGGAGHPALPAYRRRERDVSARSGRCDGCGP